MLTATIPAYLYQQYADDDDLQAFVIAYNQATQTYVDWFNSVGLPFYPGLTGPLLDWVATGLYGLERTALTSQASAALGMLNTVPLNTMVLNGYVPSTQTYYTLSDDIFKRILTWDFYKGDGKRFCIRWLKRRIMRFILGANGLDSKPTDPNFVIGTENTQAIGVQIASNVVTVTINQVLLSRFVQVAPGVLTLFQLAFQSRALDLPVQFSYVCNIVTLLTVTVTPTSQAISASTPPATTGTSTVSVFAGSGSYTYAWTWASGGAGITINTPSVAATSFTVAAATLGLLYTGLAKCTVTDTVTLQTASCTVSVNIALLAVELLAASGNWLTTMSGLPILVSYVPPGLITETGAVIETQSGTPILT